VNESEVRAALRTEHERHSKAMKAIKEACQHNFQYANGWVTFRECTVCGKYEDRSGVLNGGVS